MEYRVGSHQLRLEIITILYKGILYYLKGFPIQST
jgi:hypothetical protein